MGITKCDFKRPVRTFSDLKILNLPQYFLEGYAFSITYACLLWEYEVWRHAQKRRIWLLRMLRNATLYVMKHVHVYQICL